MSDTLEIEYIAEKTPAKFHGSDAYVRGLMGPVGSGKSVACCIDIMKRAFEQAPDKDGVRRFRAAVIRNTYPELKTTTIKTWQEWFPDSVSHIVWSSPITGKTHMPAPATEAFPDGTTLDAEIWFLALDNEKDVKKLLSMELTMAWINEAREIDMSIVDAITMRLGRYPSLKSGGPGPSWTGLIMDTNPPDDDHWWYRMAEEETPRNWKFWRQPPALLEGEDAKGMIIYMPNPAAENVQNHALGYNYWLNMVPGKRREWIKGYIMGQYASIFDGKPVYPEYRDNIHCADEDMEPMRGLPLYIGMDFGRTPAAALFQISPTGQIRVIDEVTSEDMGIRNFTRNLLKPRLNNHYEGMQYRGWGDPSGTSGGQTTEDTCYTILEEEGLPLEPAETQDPERRHDSVSINLSKFDAEGEPGLIISPRCKVLRKAFNGGYMYERVATVSGGEIIYKEKPKKNLCSHVTEGLEYGVMMIDSGLRVKKVTKKPVKKRTARGWAA